MKTIKKLFPFAIAIIAFGFSYVVVLNNLNADPVTYGFCPGTDQYCGTGKSGKHYFDHPITME